MATHSYIKNSDFNGHTAPNHAVSTPHATPQTNSVNSNQERNGYFTKHPQQHQPQKLGTAPRVCKSEYSFDPLDDGTGSFDSLEGGQPQQDLIDCVNEHIFAEPDSDGSGFYNFPVGLEVQAKNSRAKVKIEHIVSQFSKLSIIEEKFEQQQQQQQQQPRLLLRTLSIGFKSKQQLDDLIYRLYEAKIEFELDYSKFVSHPGVLFIKNLSTDLVFEDNDSLSDASSDYTASERLKKHHKLYQFLNENSHFKSLQDIRLFTNDSPTHGTSNSSDNSASSSSSSAFAIVKFSNYLDVDILIEKLSRHTPNIFNDNPSIPLFLNRYINKRERLSYGSLSGTSHNYIPRRDSSASMGATPMSTSSSTSSTSQSLRCYYHSHPHQHQHQHQHQQHHTHPHPHPHSGANSIRSSNDNFSLIILENLINFFPPNLTKDKFEQFLYKIKTFGNQIESIYFPIADKGEALTVLHFVDFGYIRFKPSGNFMENTFRMLYYLNELLWDEVMGLDMKNLPPLMEKKEEDGDFNDDEGSSNEGSESGNDFEEGGSSSDSSGEGSTPVVINRKLSVTIAQHKHNHYLFSQANQYFLTFNPALLNTKQLPIGINYPNPIYTINSFIRNVNYQETNLYVNNFSVIFNNDDVTWESFWKQFGSIKSAKIIKPHFYRDDDSFDGEEQKAGRIGFIFYETFKMAIRAILMTNNKLVQVNNFNPMVIQSSFAIQKSNPNHKAFTLPPIPPMGNPATTPLPPLDFPLTSPKSMGPAQASTGASGMQYYTYQPVIPYYYGYHPNPYMFGAQSMFNVAGATPNIECPMMPDAIAALNLVNGLSNGQDSLAQREVSNYEKK